MNKAWILFLLSPVSVWAQALPDYPMVLRVGGTADYGAGPSSLTTSATAVFLDQFQPLTFGQTSPLQTVAMPTNISGSQLRLTDGGLTTTAGYFTRFSNGQGYTVSGYNAAIGTTGVASSAPGTINRTIGVITANGTGFQVDTSTGFNDGGASPAFRSVTSVDGSSYYAGTSSGIRYQNTPGSVTSTQSIVTNNLRTVRIQDNTLFFNTTNGIFQAGPVGNPPTSSVTGTQLPGAISSQTGNPSAYQFYFFNNPLNSNTWSNTNYNTLYVADDRIASSDGGLQRWIFNGNEWFRSAIRPYELNGNLGGLRGLTAVMDLSNPSAPLVHLWATSTLSNGNHLVYLSDTLTANSGFFGDGFETLATAPANSAFRGVELSLIAVPEPATIVLFAGLSLGLAGTIYYRRQLRREQQETILS